MADKRLELDSRTVRLQGDLTGSPDLECSYFSALAAYLVSLQSA